MPAVSHSDFILKGEPVTARYQYGDLRLRKRKKGPDVWQSRYFENGRRKSVLVGTVSKLPTKADAERAVEAQRMKVNAQSPQAHFHSVTVGALMDRFIEEYAPKHCRRNTLTVIGGRRTSTCVRNGVRSSSITSRPWQFRIGGKPTRLPAK